MAGSSGPASILLGLVRAASTTELLTQVSSESEQGVQPTRRPPSATVALGALGSAAGHQAASATLAAGPSALLEARWGAQALPAVVSVHLELQDSAAAVRKPPNERSRRFSLSGCLPPIATHITTFHAQVDSTWISTWISTQGSEMPASALVAALVAADWGWVTRRARGVPSRWT